MLSPKTLKYLRLTHRYVSFICAGILFVYLLSGFLLNPPERIYIHESEKGTYGGLYIPAPCQ